MTPERETELIESAYSYNFPTWAEHLRKQTPEKDFDGNFIVRDFIGTVFSVMPSGKYYTPFANSNVSETEAEEDEVFMEALEEAAQEAGGWIEAGEGDPCDLFFAVAVDAPEDEEDE